MLGNNIYRIGGVEGKDGVEINITYMYMGCLVKPRVNKCSTFKYRCTEQCKIIRAT